MNVFERFFDNYIFSAVLIITLGMQVLMVQVFGSFANTVSQSGALWGYAIMFGAFGLPLGLSLVI